MSVLLSCRAVSFTAGTKPLFEDISLNVGLGAKIGLVGHNGSGKSSLLRLLAGQESVDAGEIATRRGLRVAAVEQFLPATLVGQPALAAVVAALPEGETAETYRAEQVLASLGFSSDVAGFRVGELSGGQQNRLMLARALVADPDLILFDEPSNHMDVATLKLLERFLADEIRCAFVLVSHDRSLLDGATEQTVFLRDQRLYHFRAPYSAAKEALIQQDIAAAASRRAEEKKIDALRASAKRLAVWGKVYDNEDLARKAKSMEKRVDRMEAQKTFVTSGSGLSLSLATDSTKANRVLRIHDAAIRPAGVADAPVLFTVDDLVIRPGDRVVLLGANGAGKTSLISALVEQFRLDVASRPADTPFAFSPQAKLGYYDQELDELDLGTTMVGYLRTHTDASEQDLRRALIHAGFEYADHTRTIKVLSGGERARLLFVYLRLIRPNFLVLDEPTNHIDIQGKEELEEQLMESGATLLMTSHDRRFIDNLATRFWLIDGGQLVETIDPASFYASLPAGTRVGDGAAVNRAESPLSDVPDDSEEALIEQLVLLESRLTDDLARKKKFQKPAMQTQWRDEIDSLKRRLGL